MGNGWSIRMKYKVFLAACTALLPTLVSAQNPQVSDCHSLEAAGNFIEPDEVLANGLVCKIVKAKPAASPAAQPSKKDSDLRAKQALLGIIEPEEVNLQDPHANPRSAPATIKPATFVNSASGGPAVPDTSAAPRSASLEEDHAPSVAEVARAYQSRRQTAKNLEAPVAAAPPAIRQLKSEALSASVAPGSPRVPAQSANIPPRKSADKPAVVMQPKPQTFQVATVPAASVPKTTASEPLPEVTLVSAPTPSASTAPSIKQAQSPSVANTPAMEPEPPSAVKAGLREPVATAPAAREVSQPEMKSKSFGPPDKPSTTDKPEVRPAIPEPASDSSSERPQEVKLGAFEAPKDSSTETKPQMPIDRFGAPPEDLVIHEPQPGCSRIVSLGTMERDRLVLATPDWAVKWLEKNQKRFPGVCFADAPLASVPNYLFVFFTSAPPASQPGLAAKVSVPAAVNTSSGSSGGTFTLNFGSTWHYTYDNAATTTVTTAWTEKVMQSQLGQTLYATAYSEQGIPISQHWPGPAKAHEKVTKDNHGRKHDAVPPAVLIMTELLADMMADLPLH
jgi:hypothetical protein